MMVVTQAYWLIITWAKPQLTLHVGTHSFKGNATGGEGVVT
jgi:hypothetical protein